jgi:hypothetical protein
MQPDDNSMHKLFVIKTLRHTNTFSKLHIVIMETTQYKSCYICHACCWATVNCWAGLLLGYCMLYAVCFMLNAWLVSIALPNHAVKSYFSNILIFHPKHTTHYTIFWYYPWYIWTYSKVLKSSKTNIFNIQLVRIYKTIYILQFYNT